MGIPDEKIKEVWIREQNYAEVGRLVGAHRNTIRTRVLKMRAEGEQLPPARKAGYALTPERAREIGRLRKT